MIVREVIREDLEGLLSLYTELNINPFPAIDEKVLSIWEEILENRHQHIIVAVDGERIVSTCEVIIIPNLTRGQTPFAFVENVVTAADHRKTGCGSAVLERAKKIAVDFNCHKIMLMTGHKEPDVIRFYEKSGYNKNDKYGFVMWLKDMD